MDKFTLWRQECNLAFLSDPGQWLTDSLTNKLVETWMIWPEYADYVEYAEYAEYAEYVEFAEYTDYAEYA